MAQGRAANNSTHHRATTKHTQHRAHSAGEHRKTQRRRAQGPRATGSARGHGATSSGTKRAQHSTQQHNTGRHNAQQRGAAPHPGTHSTTRHTALSGRNENRETQRGGGGSNHAGAANSQAESTKEGQAHGEPRSGRPTKQTTQVPRPRAPGAGNQRKPETTGAHRGRRRRRKKKEKRKTKKHQGTKQERRKPRDTKGEGRGGATTKEQPTAKRETQTRRERTESQAAGDREKQPTWTGNRGEREGGNPSPEGAKQSKRKSGQRKR